MLFSYEHKLLDIELSLASVRVTIKGQPLKFNDYEHFVRDKVENKKDFLQAGIILCHEIFHSHTCIIIIM